MTECDSVEYDSVARAPSPAKSLRITPIRLRLTTGATRETNLASRSVSYFEESSESSGDFSASMKRRIMFGPTKPMHDEGRASGLPVCCAQAVNKTRGIAGILIGVLGGIGPKASTGPAVPLFLISAYLIYCASPVWARAGRCAFSGRPELAQECTVDIDEAGIAFNRPISRAQWTWPAFIKSIEAEHVFLAYLSPCAFVILAKKLLESGQSNELRELLSRKLPAK